MSKSNGKPQNSLRFVGHDQDARTPDLGNTGNPLRRARQPMHTRALQNSLVVCNK
jgi:hypothetical protein